MNETQQATEPQRRNTEELKIVTQREQRQEGNTVHIYVQEEPKTSPKRPLLFPMVVFVLCVLIMFGGTVVHIASFWQPTATITIIPMSQQITIRSTLTIVTGNTPLKENEIVGRLLSSLVMSQTATVKATGKGHQQAQPGRGRVTFFNAALSPQVIPTGTLLTVSDGVEVVTDTDAFLPAGSLATNGQASVSAHTLITGPGGNIKAGEIYGPCCRVNVFVTNGAFTGGQSARDYQTVTQGDIDQATRSIETSLSQSIQAAYQIQVKADETLITPVFCQSKTRMDRAAGEEGSQVTVTVEESCRGAVYDTQAMQTLIKQMTDQQAMKGYQLRGNLQITVTPKDQRMLEVKASGSYVYQFSQEELDQISKQIAGKTENQAREILLHLPGIKSVSFSMQQDILPTNDTLMYFVIVQCYC